MKVRKKDKKIIAMKNDTGHTIGFVCDPQKGGCGAQFGYGKDEFGMTILFDDWEANCNCNSRGIIAQLVIS